MSIVMRWGILAAVVLSLRAPTAGADDLVALTQALGGADEIARSEARQRLPRFGVGAVPGVLPLLSSDRPAVWTAAFNVLADIANDASMPGREADRGGVIAGLMSLVAADQPREIQIRGLRLLPIVVSSDTQLAPVAALLADPDLREKARASLEEMGTPPARAALRAALHQSEPAFAAALLNSLGRLHDPETVPLARTRAQHTDPAVRAAAIRALAWTGEADALELGRQVIAAADPASRSDAVDAYLRLLGNVARREPDQAIVTSAYLELLKSPHAPEKDAALAGLARVGDASCIGPILEVIRTSEPPTSRVALEALRSLRGSEVTHAIVEAYAKQSPAVQVALLPVLGARKDALALPILEQGLRSSDATTRRLAIEALGDTGLSRAVDALINAVDRGNDADRRAANLSLLRLADSLGPGGKADTAALASQAALDASIPTETDVRVHALEGLARYPSTAAAATAQSASGDPALREPAIRALLATARLLLAKQDKDLALTLYRRVRELNPPAEAVREMVRGMREAGATAELQDLLGTINRWWVVGPFDLGEQNEGWQTEYVGEPDVNIVGRYMSGKSRVQWKPVTTDDPTGKIDLRATVANRDNCVGYAYAELNVEKPGDAVLLLGVDDSEKVWVNGEKVFELFTARGLQVDQDRIPVHFQAGKNTILLKIYQNSLGWEFCARLATPDGRPVAFTQKSD